MKVMIWWYGKIRQQQDSGLDVSKCRPETELFGWNVLFSLSCKWAPGLIRRVPGLKNASWNLNLMIPSSNVSRCRCRRERSKVSQRYWDVACELPSDVLFQELFDVLKVPVEQQRLLHGAMASIETGGGFAGCHVCCFTFSAFAKGFTATTDFEHGDYTSASYVFHLHSHNIIYL